MMEARAITALRTGNLIYNFGAPKNSQENIVETKDVCIHHAPRRTTCSMYACPRMQILQDLVHQEGWTFEGLGEIPSQLTQGEDEGVQTASDLPRRLVKAVVKVPHEKFEKRVTTPKDPK